MTKRNVLLLLFISGNHIATVSHFLSILYTDFKNLSNVILNNLASITFKEYLQDKNIDHAILENEILFKSNLIRNFVKDTQYDNIISKAILNQNRLSIEDGLTDKKTFAKST